MKQNSIEAEGNTIDEAIGEGLRELGVEREQARVEILSDAKRGLLGFGGQKARVRVSRRASVEEKLEETPASAPRTESPPAEQGGPEPAPAAPSPTAGTTPRTAGPEPEPVTVLQGILERMGISADVKEEAPGDGSEQVLQIQSDAGGLLIGRHGRTLDALEYLVNRIVSRQEEGASRIVVDTEEYRARRAESLREMARKTADRVRKRGRSLTLTPMNPRDRRVVHMALQDDPEVSTRSIGRGYFRRVIVAPARNARRDTAS